MKKFFNSRFTIITLLIVIAVLSRFFPHINNVSPIAAIALFGGAMFSDKRIAFGLPLLAMFISDIFLGFHSTMIVVYLSFALVVFIGFWVGKKVSVSRVIIGSLSGSLLFFLITNFGVWMMTNLYDTSFNGLINCYIMAIPFFRNTLLGDLIFSGVLFGGFALAERYIPALSMKTVEIN
jgi:hypothetical protein